VATEQEALDVCAAFIQLYREQAWYLERTAPWIERVGLDAVKSALFDDPDAVNALAARFRHSQQFMQDDPWAERAAGKDAELHQHLAEVRPLQMENAQ
jgi:nitrite reductase (NADH) large subunit